MLIARDYSRKSAAKVLHFFELSKFFYKKIGNILHIATKEHSKH